MLEDGGSSVLFKEQLWVLLASHGLYGKRRGAALALGAHGGDLRASGKEGNIAFLFSER